MESESEESACSRGLHLQNLETSHTILDRIDADRQSTFYGGSGNASTTCNVILEAFFLIQVVADEEARHALSYHFIGQAWIMMDGYHHSKVVVPQMMTSWERVRYAAHQPVARRRRVPRA